MRFNVFDVKNTYGSTKPSNPIIGDVYYDSNTNKIFVFESNNWLEYKVHYKNSFLNKDRMRKIKRLFK